MAYSNENKRINVTRSSMPSFEEYAEAIRPLWDSAWLTNMGHNHEELKEQLEGFLKVPNVSLFVNGHMALELCLQAMNLKGEVITTPYTFASTTQAIVRNGLTPVFCDINPLDYTIDVSKLESLITPRTSAIVPVHVYGMVCNIAEIEKIAKRHGLRVIYDAAHAFGVEVGGHGIGSFGDASMFSFHATKVFNTIEGGAITTSDRRLIDRLSMLRDFGIRDEENVDEIGANAKMNEFCAVMGLCNLVHVREEIEKRRKVAERYRENLQELFGIRLLPIQDNVKANYSYFPITVEDMIFGATRDEIAQKLAEYNIYSRKYFYPLTSAMNCFGNRFTPSDTPIADWTSKHVLTLPMYADLPLDDVDRICEIIHSCKNINTGRK